ncbi:hypothetical protein [Arthrobacter sp. UYCo732]|uniref:hypothetical protein n=1 Tax=Arthrobacter sp. UYCo732 TaxID=3156336 RepID=UPI0033949105
MGWLFDDETGAERAARIRGENQAAEHARKRNAKQSDYEQAQYDKWDSDNRKYKHAEYSADLAAFKRNPTTYERQYTSPADVPDMPGEPFFFARRDEAPAAPQSEGMPLIAKIILGIVAVFLILPAILKAIMPMVGAVLNTIWLILLSAVGLLALVWIILKLTAGDDPVKIRRAKKFNPVLLGGLVYQVIREVLAERKARKSVDE